MTAGSCTTTDCTNTDGIDVGLGYAAGRNLASECALETCTEPAVGQGYDGKGSCNTIDCFNELNVGEIYDAV